jgi:HSP20 family protein
MNLTTAITKWNPFKELEDLQNRTRSLFLKSGTNGSLLDDTLIEADWVPEVDVAEDDNEFTITADLPDVPKEQVKVFMEDGALVIQGERHREKEEKKKRYHRIERSYGKYVRSFQLPEGVDPGKIDAQYRDGVLTLHLPKAPGQKQSRQEIKVS